MYINFKHHSFKICSILTSYKYLRLTIKHNFCTKKSVLLFTKRSMYCFAEMLVKLLCVCHSPSRPMCVCDSELATLALGGQDVAGISPGAQIPAHPNSTNQSKCQVPPWPVSCPCSVFCGLWAIFSLIAIFFPISLPFCQLSGNSRHLTIFELFSSPLCITEKN